MTSKSKPMMTILVVIIRLWAAGMMFYSFYSIANSIQTFFSMGEGLLEYNLAYTMGAMLSIIMGLTAWVLAPKFARAVYPANEHPSLSVNVGADDHVMIGSSLRSAGLSKIETP